MVNHPLHIFHIFHPIKLYAIVLMTNSAKHKFLTFIKNDKWKMFSTVWENEHGLITKSQYETSPTAKYHFTTYSQPELRNKLGNVVLLNNITNSLSSCLWQSDILANWPSFFLNTSFSSLSTLWTSFVVASSGESCSFPTLQQQLH